MKEGVNMMNWFPKTIFEKDLFEKNLPTYLTNDIEHLLEGIRNNSVMIDCLQDELDGSINNAQWGNEISDETAENLRAKYLG